MKIATKNKIHPKVLAVTFTLITFILDIAGYVWHGLLQQPSIMNVLYPGFWNNPTLLLLGLLGSLVGAYILGYLFAWIYNWAMRKTK